MSHQSHDSSAMPVTYDVIIETANLRSSNLPSLYNCLSTLDSQTAGIATAGKVFLVVDSATPTQLLEQIQRKYSWVTPLFSTKSGEYYESKMFGTANSQSEVVVFADSDCRYDPEWLKTILLPFDDPAVNVVSGETSTHSQSVYERAMSIAFFFPRFSGREGLYEGEKYFANNAAFRRTFLNQFPIPSKLPVFRGNCFLHSAFLKNFKNETMWIQPRARALHDVPTKAELFERMMQQGMDVYVFERFSLLDAARSGYRTPHAENCMTLSKVVRLMRKRIGRVGWRLSGLKGQSFGPLEAFLVALIVLCSEQAFWIGYLLAPLFKRHVKPVLMAEEPSIVTSSAHTSVVS